MSNEIITQARLKELLHYNPETGVFTWRLTRSHNAKKGEIAGFLHNCGYWEITIDNCRNLAHRMAFLYMIGEMPEQVDHINHIRDDNRWHNLREASDSVNRKNQSIRKDNASGIHGVYWDKSRKKWCTRINANGKTIFLCRRSDYFEAICARKSAEVRYGFHGNHGR